VALSDLRLWIEVVDAAELLEELGGLLVVVGEEDVFEGI
jgi:hypothetical protein